MPTEFRYTYFADDHTISGICKNNNDLLRILQLEAEQVIDWFNNNHSSCS